MSFSKVDDSYKKFDCEKMSVTKFITIVTITYYTISL